MMRCRKCNRVAAIAGVFCVCDEMFIAAVEANVGLFDQPHIHQEMDLPTKPMRPIVVAVSTSISSTTSGPYPVARQQEGVQVSVAVQSPWDHLSMPLNSTITVWQAGDLQPRST